MFNYLYNKYQDTVEYMEADVLNALEMQSVFVQVLGVLFMVGAIGAENFGIPLLIGWMLVCAGWLGSIIVTMADNVVLKLYYIIHPEEANAKIETTEVTWEKEADDENSSE